MSSIWAKECLLMIVCVLSDLTLLPLFGGGRKSRYIFCIAGRSIRSNELVFNLESNNRVFENTI